MSDANNVQNTIDEFGHKHCFVLNGRFLSFSPLVLLMIDHIFVALNDIICIVSKDQFLTIILFILFKTQN